MAETTTQPWYDEVPWGWIGVGAFGLLMIGVVIHQASMTPEEHALKWGWKAGRRGWELGQDDYAECRAELALSSKKCKSLMRRGRKRGKDGDSWGETKEKVLK